MHREPGVLDIPASVAVEAQSPRSTTTSRTCFIEEQPGAARRRRDDQRRCIELQSCADEEGELTRLSFEELLGFCILLGSAGHETTARLICNSAVTLFATSGPACSSSTKHPDLLMEGAVEELLRYDPPSQVQGRWSTHSWTRHGVTIPADVRVLLLTGAAHRDERAVRGSRSLRRSPEVSIGPSTSDRDITSASASRSRARNAASPSRTILARFPGYEIDEKPISSGRTTTTCAATPRCPSGSERAGRPRSGSRHEQSPEGPGQVPPSRSRWSIAKVGEWLV